MCFEMYGLRQLKVHNSDLSGWMGHKNGCSLVKSFVLKEKLTSGELDALRDGSTLIINSDIPNQKTYSKPIMKKFS